MQPFSLDDTPIHHYEHVVWDNARWEGFDFRDGDIVVCTPYTAGTTWMQLICALLVFQRTSFDRPLADISHWMELKGLPVAELHAIYAAQSHRRIIKTHSPLDGIPFSRQATYICVLRDPRDIFMSMQNHLRNSNPESEALFAQEQREAGLEPPSLPEDVNEFFQYWLSNSSFAWETDGAPYWSVFSHAASFWMHRDEPNLHLTHFSNLKTDLEAEMRGIAQALGTPVDESIWPSLVEAAGFANMKKNADNVAPDTNLNMWKSNAQFFNKGTSGQWQGQLSKESLQLFDEVLARYPLDFSQWLLHGR
jgi:hypothetical protein